MQERLIKTGRQLKTHVGAGKEHYEDEYEVLSNDYRTSLGKFPGILAAQQYLEQQVRMERIACPTGGCED
jgi:hypothetical protein